MLPTLKWLLYVRMRIELINIYLIKRNKISYNSENIFVYRYSKG